MSFFKIAAILTFIFGLLGCAAKDRQIWWVTDSENYWNMSGFSIKPPNGSNWVKLPAKDNVPNGIQFVKIDPKPFATNPMEPNFDSTMVMALSAVLDEPVQSTKNTENFAKTIRDYLNRYQVFLNQRVDHISYDNTFGFDCLNFTAKPDENINRLKTSMGEIYYDDYKGYFCLHPEHNNFGVFMWAMNAARTGFNITNRDNQAEHFFKSLQFLPISSPVNRTFKITTYQVGKSPYQLTLYKGYIWVAIKDENRVAQIDPSNGKIVASVEVGSQPVSVFSGEHAIWVANSGDGTVTRIDPANAKIIATIPITGTPVSVSVGRGAVWVANSTGNSIIRINPSTNTVAATIPVGLEPVSVNAGKDGIWTANAGDGTVSLIDPAHDWPINTIQVGGRPVRVSLNNSGAWVADMASNNVVRIERKTRNVIARIDVGMSPEWIYSSEDGDVFVAQPNNGNIVRIDPALNRVFGPAIKLESMPRGMIYFNGSLWAANSEGAALSQINLSPFGQVVGIQPLHNF